MSEMINLINLKSMIWKTYINKYYQVVQTLQTNKWDDMLTQLSHNKMFCNTTLQKMSETQNDI